MQVKEQKINYFSFPFHPPKHKRYFIVLVFFWSSWRNNFFNPSFIKEAHATITREDRSQLYRWISEIYVRVKIMSASISLDTNLSIFSWLYLTFLLAIKLARNSFFVVGRTSNLNRNKEPCIELSWRFLLWNSLQTPRLFSLSIPY